MTGSKRNKKVKSQKSKVKSVRGQALLIIIMLLATALTVALSVSFKSTTETQVTKIEEESQKALAAAEAGIEAALKQSAPVTIGTNLSADLGAFSGTAECTENSPGVSFISPLLQKDEQYTFYLADYPGFANPYRSPITVYYASETGSTCNNVPLELTLIDGGNVVKRWIADSGDSFGSSTDDLGGSGGGTLSGFNCVTNTLIDLSDSVTYPAPQLLIVRVFADTKIGLQGPAGSSLPSQGKTCDSSATSGPTPGAGVTKKVTLFQSYPQIPAEFFVTSF